MAPEGCTMTRSAPISALRCRHAAAVLGLAALMLTVLTAATGVRALAEPQKLDKYGGYFDKRTGQYIYHRPPREMALEKAKYLRWVHFPDTGIVVGEVSKVSDADSIWIRVGYRFAYQELSQYVARDNKDDRDMMLRVDLAHVSPQETGSLNPRYEDWFMSKVAYELKQKLLGHKVTVNFEIVGGSASRLRGMVFEGKDNVNLWMVLNGWSYYVLSDGPNPYDKLFRNAEDLARHNKAGIWQRAR